MRRIYYRPLMRPLPKARLSKPAQFLRWIITALTLLPWGWVYLVYGWWTP